MAARRRMPPEHRHAVLVEDGPGAEPFGVPDGLLRGGRLHGDDPRRRGHDDVHITALDREDLSRADGGENPLASREVPHHRQRRDDFGALGDEALRLCDGVTLGTRHADPERGIRVNNTAETPTNCRRPRCKRAHHEAGPGGAPPPADDPTDPQQKEHRSAQPEELGRKRLEARLEEDGRGQSAAGRDGQHHGETPRGQHAQQSRRHEVAIEVERLGRQHGTPSPRMGHHGPGQMGRGDGAGGRSGDVGEGLEVVALVVSQGPDQQHPAHPGPDGDEAPLPDCRAGPGDEDADPQGKDVEARIVRRREGRGTRECYHWALAPERSAGQDEEEGGEGLHVEVEGDALPEPGVEHQDGQAPCHAEFGEASGDDRRRLGQLVLEELDDPQDGDERGEGARQVLEEDSFPGFHVGSIRNLDSNSYP